MIAKKLFRKLLMLLGVKEKVIVSLNIFKSEKRRTIWYKSKINNCGWGTTIDKYVNFRGKNLFIGDYCVINSFVHIWAGRTSGVFIGNRVLIASHVAITSLTHDYLSKNMRFEKAISKPVTIKDDAWIGSHAIILPGITIGKGAVIGSGAVVTTDIPDFAIAVGVPAKIINYRF